MQKRPIHSCPACGGHLHVRRLECEGCHTTIEGRFPRSSLDHLTPEQLEFVEVFLLARGNIKEVERVLGISYPTVRNRLESVLETLGHATTHQQETEQRSQIIQALNQGELSVSEAITLLRGDPDE